MNRKSNCIVFILKKTILTVIFYFNITPSYADIINENNVTVVDDYVVEDAKHFQIFDGTQYNHKPDFKEYGIKPINILYESRFWNKGDDKNRLPEEKKVRDLVKTCST